MMTLTTKQVDAIRRLNEFRRAGVRRVFVLLPGRKVCARIFPAATIAHAASRGNEWALCVLSVYSVHHDAKIISGTYPLETS